jgi:aminoglycoside phosphotransferase (APT) family kinase protein
MPIAPFTDADVERFAREVTGSTDLTVALLPEGFTNANWKVTAPDGEAFVVKVGSRASAAKWGSSQVAYSLASSAGLPVPEMVHAAELGDHLVRMFTWIGGTSALDAALDGERRGRFLASLGEAVRVLHGIRREGFSSRLDGSAQSFDRWSEYLGARLVQIRQRCDATAAVDPRLLDQVCDRVGELGALVDEVAEPVVCHRDLHLSNLIVGEDAGLLGIIDWDAAEAWDRAADWFKLETEVLRVLPDGEDALLAAYLDGGPPPPLWSERRQLVHLIEALNTLPNTITEAWEASFADRARSHLIDLLAASN